MSWFKDLVAADVNSVFLNLDEFAEEHDINGVRVRCLIDKNINSDPSIALALGVYSNTFTVYVPATEMKPPKVESFLKIDGSRHAVQSVSVEEGMLVIVCEENRQ